MQGPRLYRFFNYEEMLYLPAPVAGWNADANPWTMALNEAPVLDNFFIMPGKIRMRAPINLGKTLTAFSGVTAPVNCVGVLDGKYSCLISRRSGAAIVDAWNVPVKWVPGTSQSTISTGGIFTRTNTVNDTSTHAGVFTYTSLEYAPGFRNINFDGLLYAIGAGGATSYPDQNGNYSMPSCRLMTWPVDTSIAAPAQPTLLTNAPCGAVDLIGYQSRIWLAQGVDIPGAGTKHSCTTIFFTNPGASGVGSATSDWLDPVYGTTNKIEMDQDNGDPIMGFALVRNGLLVLRYRSVWLLRGTTTANYTLIPISRSIGCMDPRSICEADTGVYFISREGLMFCNGTTVGNVSGNVKYSLQAAIAVADQFSTGMTPAYQVRRLQTGQIMVCLSMTSLANAGEQSPLWCGIMDPNIKGGPWTRFTSNVFTADTTYPNANVFPTLLCGYKHDGNLNAIGDKQLVFMEGNSLGLPGNLSYGLQSNNQGLYDNVSTGGYGTAVPIPALWQTRILPSVGFQTRKHNYAIGKRYILDYAMQYFQANGATWSPPGWTVQPVDSTSAALGTGITVPAIKQSNIQMSPDQSGAYGYTWLAQNPQIQRASQDWQNEHGDMAFQISFAAANPLTQNHFPASPIAELYGVGLETQPSREFGHG